MNPLAEQAVTRYLDDLARMLAAAPPRAAAELLDQVREHLDTALAELGPEPTQRQVEDVVAQLGPPSAVAAGALPDVAPAVPLLSRSWLPWLVVGLVAAAIVPVLGWLLAVVGWVLVARSPRWSRRAKALGLSSAAALVVAPVGIGPLLPAPDDSNPFVLSWLGTVLLLVPVGWTLVALVLAVVAARNPRS